ncbi:hypothetical protein CKA32_006939 [Geitlerinema sp. FC II]|nr:hypothetical protein CKA32_006939 [Geitlerinema sp. FC II]
MDNTGFVIAHYINRQFGGVVIFTASYRYRLHRQIFNGV